MTDDLDVLAAPRVSRSLWLAADFLRIARPKRDANIAGITLDSRRVRPGDLYVALPGANAHGAKFLGQAVASGAVAAFTDPAGAALARQSDANAELPMLIAPDPRVVLGPLSAWVFGDPATKLKTIAVTGTNGKTTVTTLIEAAIRCCGDSVGAIGTTGVRVDGVTMPSARTTPEAPELQGMLAAMVARGVDVVAMEVSSHALVLSRVDGIVFDESIFTNLGHDHLDFHSDAEAYFAAKSSLFVGARTQHALINIDDKWGRRLFAATDVSARTYSVDLAKANWHAAAITPDGIGWHYQLLGPGINQRSATTLPGRFNVANAVAAAAAAISCGYPASAVARGIANCSGAPGRMEQIEGGSGVCAVVDYAHTPDAVAAAAAVGRELADRRGGRLLIVIGAGGDRDAAKRPQMGRAAAVVADEVVITDDNPRTEDPAAIRAAIRSGATGHAAAVSEVADRREAIADTVARADSADVVMVIGKGHETGQEINNVVFPMDDRELVRAALRARSE